MSGEPFTLDTNILIYAVDRSAGVRHELAVEIVDRAVERPCTLTIQALGEFVTAVTRAVPQLEISAVARRVGWRQRRVGWRQARPPAPHLGNVG